MPLLCNLALRFALIARKPQKDRASHEVRMVGIIWGWGFCPAELPVINFQAKPDRFKAVRQIRTIYF
jgi:hypothetical protein